MSAAEKCNDAWTDYRVPTVEEDTGAPFRYWVESDSDFARRYLVDLTANRGRGRCSCVHFQMVAEPNQRRLEGKYIPYAPGRKGVTECRHIRAALDYMHEHTTVPMLASFKNGIPSPS